MNFLVTVTPRSSASAEYVETTVLVPASRESEAIGKVEELCLYLAGVMGKPIVLRDFAFAARLVDMSLAE